MGNEYFLHEKGFVKYLTGLSLPILFQNLLYVATSAINNLMFGYFGEVEMSGYSQAVQVFFIFTVLTYGFAATCKIMVSQFWGRNNKESIRTIMGYTLRMAACFSAVFTLLFLLVPTVPMKLFSSDPAVVELGCKYLRVVSLTAILYGMSNCLYNGFGGVERTDMYLYGNVLCYGLNLAINYVDRKSVV